jgi:hypothetical protein
VAQWQLYHFTDLSHLLATATNVVITDLVEVILLLIALEGLTLAVNHRILGHNAILWGIDLDNLELNLPHATTDGEEITLSHWPVGLTEVWGEENIEERASDSLNGIGDRENSNTLGL